MNTRYFFTALLFVVFGISFAQAAETNQPAITGNGGSAGTPVGVANSVATDGSSLKFGGFGTLGFSHSSQSLGDYVLDGTIPKGAGLSNNWSAGNDSRFGAQVSAALTPKTSVVLQVISEYQADSSYHPAVEWANIKYAVTQNAYVRVGRIDLPTFLYSDNRKVGFSYPWIHPPADLYRQLSITSSDGVDGMLRFGIGESENAIRIIFGSNKLERPTSIQTARDMWGIFDTLEFGAAILRLGYQQRESSTLTLATGVKSAWVKNTDLSFAASYDPGNWFAMSEWIQRTSNTRIDALALSTGCRINKFTPYLAYSQNSQPTFISGTVTANTYRHQSTSSLGLRWDFRKNTDLKLQYDQVHLGDNTNGYLANVPVGVILYGTKFNVFSVVVDFVF